MRSTPSTVHAVVHCAPSLGTQVAPDNSSIQIGTNHSATKMPKTTEIHGGCVEEHVHSKCNKVTRISTRDDPFAHKGTYRKDKGTQLHMVIKERG